VILPCLSPRPNAWASGTPLRSVGTAPQRGWARGYRRSWARAMPCRAGGEAFGAARKARAVVSLDLPDCWPRAWVQSSEPLLPTSGEAAAWDAGSAVPARRRPGADRGAAARRTRGGQSAGCAQCAAGPGRRQAPGDRAASSIHRRGAAVVPRFTRCCGPLTGPRKPR